MKHSLYSSILESKKKGKKLFSILVDPDKYSPQVIHEAEKEKVDYIFVGGSKLKKKNFKQCISSIRKLTTIPIVIFPGNKEQISNKADAILLLSLISGRNPDYLIGEHVQAAQSLKKSGLEIIPTGYLLIGGGKKIATQLVTKTYPIKDNHIALAVSTAVAGELLGMKMIYLEAGSGTKKPLSYSLIKKVKKNISTPLLVGGGINTYQKAIAAYKAGADMVIVGNGIEKDLSLVHQINKATRSFK